MIEPLVASNNYQIACKLLDAVTLRHEAIAANVANAETPGYRRMDLAPSFAAELKASIARGDLSQTASTLQPALEQDTHARSVRPDGNSVDFKGDGTPWDLGGIMKGPAWDAGKKESNTAPPVDPYVR